MPVEPGKIRNVAVVGHRSPGKTSLVEAMLFQAGAINRLGTIEAGNTTGDWDDDEHKRQMSLAASLCHLEWQGRKINLIDTPGDPGFQGDMIAALRVVEGALVVVSAVMGVETDEALMERYLDGQELSDEEVAHALKDAVTRGEIFPVACAVATKNLGTTALLDLLVEGVPSPAKKHIDLGVEGDGTAAFVFKTIADPFAGRINVFRVISGEVSSDSTLANHRARGKERIGQLLTLQGKEHTQEPGFRAGDVGAVAKLKDTTTGDLLLDAEREVETPEIGFPEPVMSFAVTPKAKGDEEKVATALRRRHSAEVQAGGQQGNPGGDAARRACRCVRPGPPGPPRRRLLPLGRLVGDGVQDCRLDGLQAGLRAGRPGAARADHGRRGDR